MQRWSQAEVNRTVHEVKRRSLIDLEFRALALANAPAAMAKVNPKPLPQGTVIKFVDSSTTSENPSLDTVTRAITILLPAPVPEKAEELSEAELEKATGGFTNILFPETGSEET
jgi:hypothetical protein